MLNDKLDVSSFRKAAYEGHETKLFKEGDGIEFMFFYLEPP
jgi:hypothetical protein